jgi:hypothetical protein
MDQKFDTVAKAIATGQTRRETLKWLGRMLGGALASIPLISKGTQTLSSDVAIGTGKNELFDNYYPLSKLTGLNEESKSIVISILSKTDEKVVNGWLENLKINSDGKVCCTRYMEIGDILPHNDFVSLYKAIGHDMADNQYLPDMICKCPTGAHCTCESKKGFTCSTFMCY